MTDIQSTIEVKANKVNGPDKGFFTIFLATFTTVFIAEIGDKTQLATLLLSAQSGKPIIVFAGASVALISSSLIGVVVGRWLTTVLAPEKFEQLAGIMMICLSIWLGTQAIQALLST